MGEVDADAPGGHATGGGDVGRRQRAMSVLTLAGCLAGIVAIPLGWGAHEPPRFCRTAAECPDLRWPTGTAVPAPGDTLPGGGADPVAAARP